MDHTFTESGSLVEFSALSNGQTEYSIIDGEKDQNSKEQPPYSRPLEADPNLHQLGSINNKAIPMFGATNGIPEVVVMKPCSFAEMSQAIQALRERKVVILNMAVFDPEQAQRAIDFVAGAICAIDGHLQQIDEQTFLFTPSCVFLILPTVAVALP